MRGITPVVSVVLLLLVTISVVGVAMVFMQRTAQSAGEAGEEQMQQQASSAAMQPRIISTNGDKVYVQNTGSGNLDKSNLAFFVDGQKADIASGPDTVLPNTIGEYQLSGFSAAIATVVKVTSSGMEDKLVTEPKSCKGILASGRSNGDGVYKIMLGTSETSVYCDMATEGGGWALVFVCYPYGTSCYNSGQVGAIQPMPDSASTAKFSDAVIRQILGNGEKTTRTQWWQKSKSYKNGVMDACTDPAGCDVWATGDLTDRDTQWNLFENPSQWNSVSGSAGAKFKRKWGSDGTWTNWITSTSGTCSTAAGGWSNYYEQSCTQSWFAGCEGGPAINHECASRVDRADKLVIWAR